MYLAWRNNFRKKTTLRLTIGHRETKIFQCFKREFKFVIFSKKEQCRKSGSIVSPILLTKLRQFKHGVHVIIKSNTVEFQIRRIVVSNSSVCQKWLKVKNINNSRDTAKPCVKVSNTGWFIVSDTENFSQHPGFGEARMYSPQLRAESFEPLFSQIPLAAPVERHGVYNHVVFLPRWRGRRIAFPLLLAKIREL